MIDLLKIAKTEADGGNLFEELSNLYRDSDIKPNGYPEAVVWEGCLLYTSPSPRDGTSSRMPSSA